LIAPGGLREQKTWNAGQIRVKQASCWLRRIG
jgi:hypothetical protein